jgi:hypothetical protein
MSRTNGTYTAPTSGWKPALEGSVIDSSDWNTLLDDVEAAVSETVYTGGLGATDNAVVRTDGTDTKKAQGSTPTISDTGAIAGVATFLLTSYTIGTLPAGAEGQIAYASDWDVNGGASSGSLVFYDGEAWRGVDTGTTSGVAAPYNTVLPVISGTTTEGETLSTTNGTWLQSPTSYTYQWKRDGVNIASATASTYLLVAADVGATITVTVTATNAAGSTPATSAGVGPVAASTAFLGAFVKLTGDDSRNWSTATEIPWGGADDVDAQGWHDPASNNTRLTVPSGYGITRVRLLANTWLSGLASGADITLKIAKNGSEAFDDFYIKRFRTHYIATMDWYLATLSIPATAGDYFEIKLSTGGTDTLLETSSMAMIEATHRTGDTYLGATVDKAASTTGLNASAGHTIVWDAEVNDTGGWHDNVTNNTRLNVPAGQHARSRWY